MLERDYASAEKALSGFGSDHFLMCYPSKTFYAARTALARGHVEPAQGYFAAATPTFAEWVRENPDAAERHAGLGLLYAYMRRNEDALRESRRAVELDPESQDAFHGALWSANLALVYALIGDQEQSITLVERLLSTPGPVGFPDWPYSITLADLRLRWEWDSLRSNPRFQKILAAPEPKTRLAGTR
jgi:tetratricopeptide (TPR) repeat protein